MGVRRKLEYNNKELDRNVEIAIKGKKVEFEVLRIVAAFMVIFNHTGKYGYEFYTVSNNPVCIVISLCMSVICKFNVPIFLMITGALLIEKNETIGDLYKKRIPRILAAMVISGVVNYVFVTSYAGQHFTAIEILKDIYSSNSLINYYLYHYLFILVIMPFLRHMSMNMNKNECKYFFILYMVFNAILPVLSSIGNVGNIGIPIASFLTKPMFYVVIGYHINKMSESIGAFDKKKLILILIICTAFVASLKYIDFKVTGSATQIFDEMLNPLISAAVFILVKNLCKNISGPKIYKYTCLIASTTFSVFLIGDVIKNLILVYFHPAVNFLSFVWLTPMTFILSMMVTIVLKKNRILRKIL